MFVAGLAALAVHAGPTGVPSTLVGFNIPASAAEHGLRLFARQAGVEVLFEVEQVKGRQANAVEGRFTPRGALEALVAGTGLVILQDEETGAMAVKTAHPTVDPHKTLPTQPKTETAMKTKTWNTLRNVLAALFFSTGAADMAAQAQNTKATPPVPGTNAEKEEVLVLTPFEVNEKATRGFVATTTLAGNRLNADLRDIGNSVSIVTTQFLTDANAVDNSTLLAYTMGTEVGSITNGNFAGVGDSSSLNENGRFTSPNSNTRVRGLSSADSVRNLYLTDTSWDSYNIERVDIQRGPNTVLFGNGSPGGIINGGTKQALFKGNFGEFSLRLDQNMGRRSTADYNLVVLKDELAVRVNLLSDNEKFQQDPAFDDDRRAYSALRYEPKFLKIGDARTVIKVNYEWQELNSNRPRTLPPQDRITAWFNTKPLVGTYRADGRIRNPVTGLVENVKKGDPRVFPALNRRGFDPRLIFDGATSTLDRGQASSTFSGGPNSSFYNPGYQPEIGGFGRQSGGIVAAYQTPGAPPIFIQQDISTQRGFNSSGRIDAGIDAFAFTRTVGIAPSTDIALNAGLPFSQFGLAKDNNLTDPGIFDFYNNLLDGPNKREWQNSRVFEFSIAQTFWKDMVGIEYGGYRENYDNGQLSLLTGTQQAIFVDMNSLNSDGTPNPDFGRPFISDNGIATNNSIDVNRKTDRVTGFVTYNFDRNRKGNLWEKIAGRQTLTGLYDDSRREIDDRRWMQYSVIGDPTYRSFVNSNPNDRFDNGIYAVGRVIYMGPSLLNIAGPSAANIPGPKTVATVPRQITVRGFDSTWNAPSVDPAAPFVNTRFPVGDARRNSTQSENPANYVGFVNRAVNVIDAENPETGGRDRLTRTARKLKTQDRAKAFSYQGNFWDNSVVFSYSRRRDETSTWGRSLNGSPIGGGPLNLSPDVFKLPDNPDSIIETNVDSYSAVSHFDQLPLLGKLTRKLPVSLSLTWARSANSQPEASRADLRGSSLPTPTGATKEMGFIVESRDRRFGLRINRYETKIKDVTSSTLVGRGFIGNSQSEAGNSVNIFHNNLISGSAILPDRSNIGNPATDPNRARYTYLPQGNETQADADRREAAAIAAWRGWQAKVPTLFPGFYEAWKINSRAMADASIALGSDAPGGLSFTEDSISKGWEFELNANLMNNWRMSLNATKTNATRTNVGGAALLKFATAYEDFLLNGGGGDLRIGSGSPDAATALTMWNQILGSELVLKRLQEGTNVPELREWRVNAITTYEFERGRFKGWYVGGGIRWQDAVVTGFTPIQDRRDPAKVSFDLSRPFKSPTETNVDLWWGYSRKLTDKIRWKIQFNISNVGKEDDVIAVTSQPDGTTAGYRIAPRQYWSITNTLTF